MLLYIFDNRHRLVHTRLGNYQQLIEYTITKDSDLSFQSTTATILKLQLNGIGMHLIEQREVSHT